jgi:hypothetical protein
MEVPDCLRVGTGRRLADETLRASRGDNLSGKRRSGWKPRTLIDR